MNKKGFTLVELLAVIVILGSIGVVAVLGISNSLDKQETKEAENQEAKIKNAAKIYFSLNTSNYVATENCEDEIKGLSCVTIKVLLKEEYLENDDIENYNENDFVSIYQNQVIKKNENCNCKIIIN